MRIFARFVLYRLILRPFLSLIIGVKFPKASSFPEGQFILVSNHNSHLDTVSLLCSLPVNRLGDVHPAAAADYFARNKVMATLCEFFLNTVFVRRKGEGGQILKPLDELDMHVKAGKSLILFPEGTRGLPEQITDFKCGAAVLLQRNPHVKLVPVFMIGMGKAMPKGGLPIPSECEIRIGKSSIDETTRNRPVMELTAFIQDEVLRLKEI
ncbi:lysophospholipid acyltransferase family protein [Peredibacter sp. HCB2-198]|uniref:lysophospholipid acyltransferase family protein n=1 Tax=Peredibacter sp. HCB2-198 TaxID=3383025 RepID=UPI0038B5D5B9